MAIEEVERSVIEEWVCDLLHHLQRGGYWPLEAVTKCPGNQNDVVSCLHRSASFYFQSDTEKKRCGLYYSTVDELKLIILGNNQDRTYFYAKALWLLGETKKKLVMYKISIFSQKHHYFYKCWGHSELATFLTIMFYINTLMTIVLVLWKPLSFYIMWLERTKEFQVVKFQDNIFRDFYITYPIVPTSF